jgi:NADH-quinone oxidoreductase subunit H
MAFAMFFLAEYINIVTVAAVATSLYLGGWQMPFVPELVARFSPELSGLLTPLWFLIKVGAICFFYIWMRWTLPRLRYDQLMVFGWKVLLPLAALNLLITAAGVIYLG